MQHVWSWSEIWFWVNSWKPFPVFIMFLCCDRQSAFLEQCDVSDDEYGEILDETMEARSSNKMLSTDSSSIADKANDSLMEASEVHECAFCRSEVLSLSSFLDNKLCITWVDNDEVSFSCVLLLPAWYSFLIAMELNIRHFKSFNCLSVFSVVAMTKQ